MSYSANKARVKIRNSEEAIMFESWKDQFQDREVSPVKSVMFGYWED